MIAVIAATIALLGACSQPQEQMPDPALTLDDVVILDDLAVADSSDPRQLSGSTVSGTLTVGVNPRFYLGKVEFFLDSRPGRSEPLKVATQAPYAVQIDTTKLDDGPHALITRTWVRIGRWQRPFDFAAKFTVANGQQGTPSQPGQPGGPSEPGEPGEPGEISEPGDASEPSEPGQPGGPSNPSEPSEPSVPSQPNPPAEDSGTELRGDPSFNRSALSSDARLWYDRFWAGLESSGLYPDAMAAARKGDLYGLGRYVNVHVSTILTAFRYTGDLKLLDEADRYMQAARSMLRDTNGDGYLNWTWLHDPNNSQWYGDDRHEMDESITHGFVAAMAWAYQNNRDLTSPAGVNYGERADFWKNYLVNHFEAKWRARSRVSAGSMKFLQSYLIHTWTQYTRYFWYMGKLTGDGAYTAEAEGRAAELKRNFSTVTAAGKQAYVYPWGMVTQGSPNGELMPTVYGQYVTQGVQDLVLDGMKTLTSEDLKRLANGVAGLVVTGGTGSYGPTVGGSSAIGGRHIGYTEGPRGGNHWAIYAYSPALAAADSSGKIAANARQLHGEIEGNANQPRRIFLSAAAFINSVANSR